MAESNGWNEWSRHVLKELEKLTESTEVMRKELQDFKVDIAKELAKKSDVDSLRDELGRHKLERIEEVASIRADLTKQITELQSAHTSSLAGLNQRHSVEIAELKTDLKNKAGAWGAVAGMIPVVFGLMMMGLKAFMG